MMHTGKAFPLKDYNTFGLDVKARYFLECTEEKDIPLFLETFEGWGGLPFLLMGGGSNLLFVHDFDGVVIHVNIPGIKLIKEYKNHVWVEAGAGENWDTFVSWCVCNDYHGIENLSLIPGNVGASPVQNIGAYGVEVKDFIEMVKGFDLETLQFVEIPAGECQFAYRDSIFKNSLKGRVIVTSVVFCLAKFADFQLQYGNLKAEVEKHGGESLKHVREAVISVRQNKLPDPRILGNAGSFFKNPVVDNDTAINLKARFSGIPVYSASDGRSKLSAGWMIEQCGWKGFREGDAGVYEKQALILVNHGKATGEHLLNLSEKIKKSVIERFGVELEPEVNVI